MTLHLDLCNVANDKYFHQSNFDNPMHTKIGSKHCKHKHKKKRKSVKNIESTLMGKIYSQNKVHFRQL